MLKTALSQCGIMETQGDKSNPEINKYFSIMGQTWADDETSWCSAFINWVAITAGYESSGQLNARSWLDVGEVITNPEPGDIVVLWRESKTSWKGHVGIFCSRIDDAIWVYGGNQNNMVKLQPYPASRVLGYRRLKKL